MPLQVRLLPPAPSTLQTQKTNERLSGKRQTWDAILSSFLYPVHVRKETPRSEDSNGSCANLGCPRLETAGLNRSSP